MLLDLVFPSSCPACGAPGRDLCPSCREVLASPPPRLPTPPGLDRLVAGTAYRGPARTLLLRAKAGRRELLRPLGERLARLAEVAGLGGRGVLVIAVPSHLLARWRRGFDPAREIAGPVAARLGCPLHAGLVRRLPALRASKGLSASDRRAAVENAFRAPRPLPGARVLLVDDVLTTGATLSACARALRAAGAAEVSGAVWARTPRGL